MPWRQWQWNDSGGLQLTERFDLTYKGSDNELQTCNDSTFWLNGTIYAILCTAGNFPLWLPEQAIILS
jgi:threonyl-tRNA synthetase